MAYTTQGAVGIDFDGGTESTPSQPLGSRMVGTDASTWLYVTAVTSGEYAWVQLTGTCTINVLASAAANVILYSSATAGSLDDTATSHTRVDGIKLSTARGGTAGSAPAIASYPKSFVI